MSTAVKERPILFSAPMVRAILSGDKTQTRRICKSQPYSNGFHFDGGDILCHNDYLPPSAMLMDFRDGGRTYTTSNMEGWDFCCPYGQPGDRLWVRETWQAWHQTSYEYDEWEPISVKEATAAMKDQNCVVGPTCDSVQYRATSKSMGPWTPSIHMPRWACRILLEVTGVRVERLQDISEADALAEGIIALPGGGFGLPGGAFYHAADPRQSFFMLWESINGDGSVKANPWVWVVEFRRMP